MKPVPSLIFAVCLAAASAAHAQAPAPRALPVEDSTAPRAIPVEPGAAQAPPRAAVVDDPNKPKGPDEDLFDYASLAYSQKDYNIAAQSFGKYLATYAQGRHVAEAMFRLGECYRNQGQMPQGERYYREVVDKFPKSEFSSYAAYWLGVSSYNNKDFKGAATYFAYCETRATVAKVKLAASFYKSEAYGGLGDRKKQLEALKPVLAEKKENEFLERALLSAATVHQADGKNQLALPMLMELLDTSTDAVVQGNAALKAALIQSELKKPDLAIDLYQRVLKNAVTPQEQRGVAMVGLIGELYAKGDYDGVVDTYNRNATNLPPPELRPRMLVHVGNAQRMKKNFARAIELYDMVLQYFPKHELAFESAYWKVFCAYQAEDRRLPEVVGAFLAQYEPGHQDHEFINTARLLLADYHFYKQNYKLAADAYGLLNIAKLPERFRPSTLFHRGSSLADAGRHADAIESLKDFIKTYPNDKEIPRALAKRGLSYKETQNPVAALDDFGRIIKDFPESETLELAYYLSGVIHYEQRNWKATIADFDALTKKFPNTPVAAAAEAAYKTGLAYVELKDTAKALPYFHSSVRLDEKAYGNVGTQKVLLCLWNQKDVEGLAKAVDEYRGKYSDAILVPRMLGYLGLNFFDRKDYARASKYLTWASTPEVPENTEPVIWNYLGQSLLEVKSYEDSVKAMDNFLKVSPENMTKAKGFLTKASAQIGLGKFDDSLATAEEGLKMVKDGILQMQLLIVQGDALLAQGDKLETDGNHVGAAEKWQAAAGKYIVPSQIIDDEKWTPTALEKAASALDRVGQKEKAAEMRDALKKKYPNFKPGA